MEQVTQDTPPIMGVRESIQAALDEHRQEPVERSAPEPDDTPVRPTREKDDRGRFVKQSKRTSDTEDELNDIQKGKEPEQVEPEPEVEVEAETPVKATKAAPAAWTRQAKEAWNDLPDIIKDVVLKREQDTEKGIHNIKQKYAEIDTAFEPLRPHLRQAGITEGRFIGNIVPYLDSLGGRSQQTSPDQAIANLVYTNRINPDAVIQRMQQLKQAYQQQPQQQQPHVVYDPRVNELMAEREAIKTEKNQAIIDNFASNHPYAHPDNEHSVEVKKIMGHLLTPNQLTGVSVVPLTPDGKVDLETAYNKAILMIPEIQAQIQAERAREQASRAAKEARKRQNNNKVLPTNNAPSGADIQHQARSTGKSVRESLRDSIRELSN